MWHCGNCHSPLLVTRKAKGTKYLFCPKCDEMKAYFNILPLLAAALPFITKAATKALPFALDVAENLFSGDSSPQQQAAAARQPRKHSTLEKALMLEQFERSNRRGKSKKS